MPMEEMSAFFFCPHLDPLRSDGSLELKRSVYIKAGNSRFGLKARPACDQLLSGMTWRCLDTSGILSFNLGSPQYLVYCDGVEV